MSGALPGPLTVASPAERHRRIAEAFTQRVESVINWDAPAPVDVWTARDVVDHLVTWFPGFLAAGSDIELPTGPPASDDPVGAWRIHADAVQDLLDHPARTDMAFDHPQVGAMPLPDAIDRFYTVDVFMHTWDLARATDQDDVLDADLCEQLFAGMEPMAEMLYASGQYGPRVEVPENSDAQTRLLGLIGRDPQWRPPSPPS